MMRLGNLLQKKVNTKSLIFYVAFSLVSVLTMAERSALIEVPHFLGIMVTGLVMLLFIVKIIIDGRNWKELFVAVIFAITFVLLEIFGAPSFMLTSCFAFLAMRGVDIRTVVKIDVLVKSVFLASHALIFAVDYVTGLEFAQEFVASSAKGTTMSLYFRNPNTTGLIGTWLALDLLYLKNNKKIKDYIFPTLVALSTFVVTTSRASFLIYVIYLGLQLIKSPRKLTILQKIIYPLFFFASLWMVLFISVGSPMYDTLNHLTSGRIGFSLLAFDLVGFNILPSASNSLLLEQYILDVFYVRCMVDYGVMIAILYYLPHLLLPKDSSNEIKRISIITSVYMLFERATANIGFAIPYLMIADAIYNGKKNEDKVEK